MKEDLQKPEVVEDAEVNVYKNEGCEGGGFFCGMEW
jgi:hypothetical protein